MKILRGIIQNRFNTIEITQDKMSWSGVYQFTSGSGWSHSCDMTDGSGFSCNNVQSRSGNILLSFLDKDLLL